MPKKFSDLQPFEQAAYGKYVQDKINDLMSTKNPDSLRYKLDEQVVANYETYGAKSYDVKFNGQKVGTYSVRMSKGKPRSTCKQVVINDSAKFEKYINNDAPIEAIEYAQICAQNFAEFLLENYGIIGDGVQVIESTVAAEPPRIVGTTLKVDEEKLRAAAVGYFEPQVFGLIGDGGDE